VAEASMSNYAAAAVRAAEWLPPPRALCGWSMGGLVALMAAAACRARACVGLAPSAPARTRDSAVPLRAGTFGPEEYGIVDRDPERQPAMDLDRDERVVALESLGPESRFARDERKAGVVTGNAPCPILIVTGTADALWPRQRYDELPFVADHLEIVGASHWGLVLNRRLLPAMSSAVGSWLEKNVSRGNA
jgi:pimeloyl-ACP methyl ester carboxylesterase